MPISISNLGEKIGYPKLPYPYNFINEKTIFYKGIKPNLEF